MNAVANENAETPEAIFAQLEADRIERQNSDLRLYRELVARMADGTQRTAKGVAQILDAVRRTPKELADDVKTLLRRRELAAGLETLRIDAARRAAIADEQAAEIERHRPAREVHEARLRKLSNELEQIDGRLHRYGGAEYDLRTSAPLELQDKLAAVIQQTNEATAIENRIRKEMNDRTQEAGELRRTLLQESLSDYRRNEINENRLAFEARAALLAEEIRPWQAKLEELRAQADEILQLMMAP